MLCPPGADVGESMYPTPKRDGFYSSPTPPLSYKSPHVEIREVGKAQGLL